MMKQFHKKIIIMFGMIMLIGVLFFPSSSLKVKAAADQNYGDNYQWIGRENSDGTLTITGCNGVSEYVSDGVLEIPSEIDGKIVTKIDDYDNGRGYGFEFSLFSPELVTTLIFPDTVTYLDGFFDELINLKTVVFPRNPDTYNGAYFKGLNVENVSGYEDDIYYFTDSVKTFTVYDEYSCSLYKSYPSLETLNLSDSIEIVTLYNCPNLVTLDLPDSVETVELSNCPNLATLNYTKSIEDIRFKSVRNCPNLVLPSIYIKGDEWWTGGDSLYENSNIKNIYIDANVLNHRALDKETFRGAQNLEGIHVTPGSEFVSVDGVLFWDNRDNPKIYDLFAYPAGKSTTGNYDLPKEVSCIYGYAFDSCNFKTITIPEDINDYFYWDSVYAWEGDTMSGYFKKCSVFDFSSATFRMVKYSSAYYGIVNSMPESGVQFYLGSKYKISYKLNGGNNNSSNPSSYQAGELITLKNPARTGYKFAGWTRNDGGSNNTTIPESVFGDYTFEAHWEKNVETEKVETKKVNKITISGISKKIAAGKKITLSASVLPANATNQSVTWKSSNKKLATVSSNGVVKTKKKAAGKFVTITATAKDGSGVKATYKIKVVKGQVKKVAIKGKKTVKAGKTLTLKAKVTATTGANTKIKWKSSNTKYATVSSKGKVKALKAGKGKTVKITATTTDGTGIKATIKIKIKK